MRPSPSRRGYGGPWPAIRLEYLRHHPLCEDCLARGLKVAATDVDHVVSLARGGTHDPSNLRALDHRCHSRKTARVDGRFGRRAPRAGR